MKVYVLIPVFNRLAHTQAIVECLRRQVGVAVQMVVIDDGSSDGTDAYLATQGDILTIRGNGHLWWGGAIDRGLRLIHPRLEPGDFFAFVNNDTRIDPDFLAVLVATSLRTGGAVGSVVRAIEAPHRLLDIGARANLWKLWIWDIAATAPAPVLAHPSETYAVDFLSGRGALYPGEVLDAVGYMRPRLLPHYLADYEFSDRVRRAGFPLLVATGAATYSAEEFGSQRLAASLWQRLFDKRSADNALHRIAFFLLVGSAAQRWTALPRMLAPVLKRRLPRRMPRVVHSAARWLGRVWGRLREVAGFLRSARRSTMARARIRAAVERRGAVRPEALHVYAAALTKELSGGQVVLLGPLGERHVEFFRRLRVGRLVGPGALTGSSTTGADLVFLACDAAGWTAALANPNELPGRLAIGGVLYCVDYGDADASGSLGRLLSELTQTGDLRVVADGTAGWPGARSPHPVIPDQAFGVRSRGHGGGAPARFFAVQRVR